MILIKHCVQLLRVFKAGSEQIFMIPCSFYSFREIALSIYLPPPPPPSSPLSMITFRLHCYCSALLISSLCVHVLPVCAPHQSIDPGQQFTWEHSNLEVNKPKNRYANVIAYDHSRVILAPIEGKTHPSSLSAHTPPRRGAQLIADHSGNPHNYGVRLGN